MRKLIVALLITAALVGPAPAQLGVVTGQNGLPVANTGSTLIGASTGVVVSVFSSTTAGFSINPLTKAVRVLLVGGGGGGGYGGICASGASCSGAGSGAGGGTYDTGVIPVSSLNCTVNCTVTVGAAGCWRHSGGAERDFRRGVFVRWFRNRRWRRWWRWPIRRYGRWRWRCRHEPDQRHERGRINGR